MDSITPAQVRWTAVMVVFLCYVSCCRGIFVGLATDEITSPVARLAAVTHLVCVTALLLSYNPLQRSVVTGRPSRPWPAVAVVFSVVALVTEIYVTSAFFDAVIVVILIFAVRTHRQRLVVGLVVALAEVLVLVMRPYTVGGKMVLVCLNAVVGVVLVTFALLARTLVQLELSREQLARLSVDQERARISRDLHDIIGRTLVAVSLRQEAALSLLDRDASLARRQLEASGDAIREGQSQLRALTHGPMTASVDAEVESARSLCERAGIRLEAEIEQVDKAVDPECAFVIREAVTNMLKHASAKNCWISVRAEDGRAVTTVTNDGSPDEPMDPTGSGIDRMRRRLIRLGGGLDAGPDEEGQFTLTATIPLETP